MRYLIVLPCVALSGCFAYVPNSVFDSSNTCVAEDAYVGQRICNKGTGKCGTLKEMKGRSERCQSGAAPILGRVEYE